jgi:hypothetical protein
MAIQSPDPWSQGINAAAGVATAALKPAASEAHKTSSSAFDNSGWSVNIGPGASQSTNRTDLPSTAQALGAAAASGASLLSNPMFIIALGLGVFLFLKHK